MRKREVSVARNVVVAPDVHRLTFRPPPGENIEFRPGEFVTFYFPKGPVRITRSYSIASDPEQKDQFELLVKRVEGGYASNVLARLSPGDRLLMLGPLGKFLLRDPEDRTVVFACTGTGVAPFLPMSHSLLRDHPALSVWMFCGSRTPPDILCGAEFERLEETYGSFHYVPTLSRPSVDWTGATGHIEVPFREHFQNLSGCDLYICGVPEMVLEMLKLGEELHCPRERTFIEKY